jgi:hypothetical protein
VSAAGGDGAVGVTGPFAMNLQRHHLLLHDVDVAIRADRVLILKAEDVVRRVGADELHALVEFHAGLHVAAQQSIYVHLGEKVPAVLAEQLEIRLILEALGPRRDAVDNNLDRLVLDVRKRRAGHVHDLVRRHAEPAADLLDEVHVHLDKLRLGSVLADRLDIGVVVEVRRLVRAVRPLEQLVELGALRFQAVYGQALLVLDDDGRRGPIAEIGGAENLCGLRPAKRLRGIVDDVDADDALAKTPDMEHVGGGDLDSGAATGPLLTS